MKGSSYENTRVSKALSHLFHTHYSKHKKQRGDPSKIEDTQCS